MSALLELAERCEQATGPDRELDAEIAKLNGFNVKHINEGTGWHWVAWPKPQCDGPSVAMPRYTASIDAASTLVPEGLVWSLNTFGNPPKASGYVMNERGEQWRCIDYPATPALALCAAALRARAAQ